MLIVYPSVISVMAQFFHSTARNIKVLFSLFKASCCPFLAQSLAELGKEIRLLIYISIFSPLALNLKQTTHFININLHEIF